MTAPGKEFISIIKLDENMPDIIEGACPISFVECVMSVRNFHKTHIDILLN